MRVPRPQPRFRRAQPDRLAELRARVTDAAAALEAGASRLDAYEEVLRYARRRQGILAGDLADALAALHAEEDHGPTT